MANVIYPKWKSAREKALTPDMSSSGTAIKAVLIDLADYTYSASHEFLSDIPSGARVAISPNLTAKTVSSSDGTFDAADTAFVAATGDVSEAIALYHDTGTVGTSRLIVYIDSGVTGLPVTPNGLDIPVAWHPSGIYTP